MERSRFVTVALIAFSLLTAFHARYLVDFSIGQMIILLAMAAAVHGTALLCTDRKFVHAISPLVSFALLIVVLLITNSGGDITKMLPTPESLIAVFDSIQIGVETIKSNESPFPGSTEVLLLSLVLIWSVAEVAETLAQRLHSSAPTLLWYIFLNAAIAAQQGAFSLAISIVMLCACSWLFLYAFDKGHEKSRAHLIEIPSSARISSVLYGVISFVALVSLSLLMALPATNLPSLAPKNLFEFLDNSPNQTELSPLVGMKQLLDSPTNELLFTASAPEAQYFRTAVLDDFYGDSWSSDSEKESRPETIPPGTATRRIESRIQMKALARKYLPTIYNVQSISADDVTFLEGSVVFAESSDINSYSVRSNVPTQNLTPEQIATTSQDIPESVESSILIPQDFDEGIIELSQEIASGRSSIYEQVIALRDFFLDGSFTYDLNVDYTSSTQAMVDFLEERRGFCEQFATTYAAMARSVGIPARVVVGFTPGEADLNGQFEIRSRQAHSWVEVYLADYGWLTVDPTPAGPLPGQAPTNIGAAVVTTTTTTAPTTTVTPNDSTALTTTTIAQNTRSAQESQGSNVMPATLTFIALALAGGAFLFMRKRYWNDDKNVEVFVIDSFKEIGHKVLDMEPQPSLTISELQKHVPKENTSINEFLDLLDKASYSPDAHVSLSDLRAAAMKARAEKVLTKI